MRRRVGAWGWLEGWATSKFVDDLEPDELIGFELGQHLNHAFVPAFMELAHDIGSDVRRRCEDPEQVGPSTRWKPTKAANRVHTAPTPGGCARGRVRAGRHQAGRQGSALHAGSGAARSARGLRRHPLARLRVRNTAEPRRRCAGVPGSRYTIPRRYQRPPFRLAVRRFEPTGVAAFFARPKIPRRRV